MHCLRVSLSKGGQLIKEWHGRWWLISKSLLIDLTFLCYLTWLFSYLTWPSFLLDLTCCRWKTTFAARTTCKCRRVPSWWPRFRRRHRARRTTPPGWTAVPRPRRRHRCFRCETSYQSTYIPSLFVPLSFRHSCSMFRISITNLYDLGPPVTPETWPCIAMFTRLALP